MEDGTAIPIFRNGLRMQQRFQQKNIRTLHGHETDNKTLPLLTQALATIEILAQRQSHVSIHAKLHGLVVIQPEPMLFDKRNPICTFEVAQVKRNEMFQLLIANFANQTRKSL